MVQRTAVDYNLRAQDTRRMSSPTVAAGNVRADHITQVGDQNWRSNLLGNLVQFGTGIASKLVDNATTNAYLKGSADAAAGKAEEELQSDPFTKDWQTAGFRDTMGRVKQAEADAQLEQDMPRLRTQSPAEMAAYLDAQRSDLLPALAGMSGEARSKMIPNMAIRDQAAISKHKGLHQQHIWDVQGKGFTAPITQGLNDLTSIREMRLGGEAYQDAEKKVVGRLLDMRISSLPTAQKDALTLELLEFSLANQHLGLYQALSKKLTPDTVNADGTFSSDSKLTVLEQLPVPVQEKLSKAYVKAKEATQTIANQDYFDTFNSQLWSLKNGVSTLDYDQVRAIADAGTMIGLSPEKRDSLFSAYYESEHKKGGNLRYAQAWMTNQTNTLFSDGKTVADGRTAAIDTILKGKTVPEQLLALGSAIDYGNTDAAKVFGERIAPSIASLAVSDGKITPEHNQNLDTMYKLFDSAKGNSIMMAALSAGIPEELQARVDRLRALHASGQTGAPAVARMLEMEKAEAGMSKQEKAVASRGIAEEDQKYLNKIGNEGWLSRTVDSVVGLHSRDSAVRADMELRGVMPDASPDTRAIVRDSAIRTYKTGMREEMQELANRGMTGDSESRAVIAMGQLMRRSVRAGEMPIILPKGSTPHKYFETDPATPVDMIDKALGNRIKPTADGGYMDVTATATGLAYQEWDRNGVSVPTNAGMLSPSTIRDDVKALHTQKLKPTIEEVGEGVTYKDKNIEFKYNGVNTAGVSTKDMLAFRKTMVEQEGVKTIAYEDLSGKLKPDGTRVRTVGVGVSETNPEHFPKLDASGRVTPDQLVTSFKGATNAAAKRAVGIQEALGLPNSAAFQLFAGLSYQGLGQVYERKDKGVPFAKAMQSKDKVEAIAALKQTTAYKMSQHRRQALYERLTLAALEN